jgi:hypothetical protein
MLPFRVIQIEQHPTLQQKAAELNLTASSHLTKLSCEHNCAAPNSQIPQRPSRRDFAGSAQQNTASPTRKKELFSQSGCTTFNRNGLKNRSYGKQTIKPCLTESQNRTKASSKFDDLGQGSDELYN